MPGPGERKEQFRRRSNRGRFGLTRRAWLHLGEFEFILYVKPEREDQPEPGTEVFMFAKGSKGSLRFNLTQLNYDQLSAMRQMFELAFEAARPVVEVRDLNANEALTNYGDTSFARLWRPMVRLFKREGEQFLPQVLRTRWAGNPTDEIGEVLNITGLLPPLEEVDLDDDERFTPGKEGELPDE